MLCRLLCFVISAVLVFFVGGFVLKALYFYNRFVGREDDFWGIANKARGERLFEIDTAYLLFGVASVAALAVLEVLALAIKAWLKRGFCETSRAHRCEHECQRICEEGLVCHRCRGKRELHGAAGTQDIRAPKKIIQNKNKYAPKKKNSPAVRE